MSEWKDAMRRSGVGIKKRMTSGQSKARREEGEREESNACAVRKKYENV